MSISSSGGGSFASKTACRRSVRWALRVALLATRSSHGSAESPLNRISPRRRHASRNTAEVRSSAVDQEPVRVKQCAYTRSEYRSKSSPKASPANSLVACDQSSWSLASCHRSPTPIYVRQRLSSSITNHQGIGPEGKVSPDEHRRYVP